MEHMCSGNNIEVLSHQNFCSGHCGLYYFTIFYFIHSFIIYLIIYYYYFIFKNYMYFLLYLIFIIDPFIHVYLCIYL